MTPLLAGGAGVVALASGVLLLRAACRAPAKRRGARTLAGWALLAVGLGLWSVTGGPGLAFSLAALVFSLLAYAVVAASAKIRTRRAREPRERDVAEDPLVRPRRLWRIGARILLAGPLSLVFGVAVCLALATRSPIVEVDAVMLGAMLAPFAFAGAMAWSLTDERLARVAVGLGVSSVLMIGLAAWRI